MIIEHLGHKLIKANSKTCKLDNICLICNIRVGLYKIDNAIELQLVEGYKSDDYVGNYNGKYNLTCDEQLIKNLLE